MKTSSSHLGQFCFVSLGIIQSCFQGFSSKRGFEKVEFGVRERVGRGELPTQQNRCSMYRQ